MSDKTNKTSNSFIDTIAPVAKGLAWGTGLGILGGAGLGGYFGMDINPNEIDVSSLSQEELQYWQQLTPDQQQQLLAATASLGGAIAGGVIGGGIGTAYGIGKVSANSNQKTQLKESIMYLNENAIITILSVLEETSNGKPKIEIKHPGAFTDWCKKQGFDGVTCECICKAMATDNPTLHKRANFAYNFAFKKNGKTCDCMENRKK